MAKITRVAKAGASKHERRCCKCGHVIEQGESYAHQSIKTGPRSSQTRVWCHDHSDGLRPSEVASNSRTSTLLSIGERIADAKDDPEALADALDAGADDAEQIGNELTEGADNIERGFGHETEQSSEMAEKGNGITEWGEAMRGKADELRQAIEALATAISEGQEIDEPDF